MPLVRSLNSATSSFGRFQQTTNNSRTAVSNFQKSVVQANSNVDRIQGSTNRAGKSLSTFQGNAVQANQGITQAKNGAGQATGVFDRARAAADRLGTSVRSIKGAGSQAGGGLGDAKNQSNQADAAFGRGTKAADGLKNELNGLEKQSGETKKSLSKVTTEADGVDKSVGRAGKGAGAGKALFSDLSSGLGLAEGAQKGLNGAMKASAFGVIIALVLPLIEHFGGLGEIADKCKVALVKAWEGIRDGIKPIISGLMDILKAPVNGWLAAVNFLIRGINKIHIKIPGWVPAIGGKEFGVNLPELPMLAKGGIVRPRAGGTAALLAEAGEAEAVIPLSKLEKYLGAGGTSDGPTSTQWQALVEAVQAMGRQPLVVAVDGQAIARATRLGERQLARR